MTRKSDPDARGFSIREIGYLSKLPAVEHVTRGRIVYSEDFKIHCVRRYLAGESPARIFRRAGLDSSLIGYKRIERCIARWKNVYGNDERVRNSNADETLFDVPQDQRWVPPIGTELPDVELDFSDFDSDLIGYSIASHGGRREAPGNRNRNVYELIIMQQARRIDALEREVDALKAQQRSTVPAAALAV